MEEEESLFVIDGLIHSKTFTKTWGLDQKNILWIELTIQKDIQKIIANGLHAKINLTTCQAIRLLSTKEKNLQWLSWLKS